MKTYSVRLPHHVVMILKQRAKPGEVSITQVLERLLKLPQTKSGKKSIWAAAEEHEALLQIHQNNEKMDHSTYAAAASEDPNYV